ncbi:MAG: DUF5689 domain-containing protein [Crocinitomix sp.]|nr:DUF5689 domain-containing protein [Crocinitomix sp.]
MKRYILNSTFVLALGVLALSSCKKEYDTPPLEEIPETDVMTIDELRTWQETEGGVISIQEELSVYGIITMDETDGNVYKNIYMQDHTGAVNVRMLSGGGVYQGDSVRIYLKGTILSKYNGVLQIDSVDVDKNIIKQSTNNTFAPEDISIDLITALKESELIRINDVQFIKPEVGQTFADGEELISLDRILEDADGNTIKLRTSGYAAFADQLIPEGSGSIVCIVSHFNGEVQLLIRSFSEIAMTSDRFSGLLIAKDFDDGEITTGDWITYQVAGPEIKWETSSAGGAPNDYGVISNYLDGVNVATENWLISPSIDLSSGAAPYLNFDNACSYDGAALEIYVSTDYDGTINPNEQGSWTNISVAATLSTGFFTWVNSTNVPIATLGTNVHIAFKYTGSASDGRTWELDNIIIHE